MKLSIRTLAFLLAIQVIATGSAESQILTHGPVVGGVTASEAKVFVRTDTTASVALQYGTDPALQDASVSDTVVTSAANDFTAMIALSSLTAETTYYLNVLVNGVPQFPSQPFPFLTTFPPADFTDELYYVAPDGSQCTWDRYMPDPAPPPVGFGPGPYNTVLLVHGGGFKSGSKTDSTAMVDLAVSIAAKGWVAISINYRLAPETEGGNVDPLYKLPGQTEPGFAPRQSNDCKMALKTARLQSWCNPAKVGMAGGSGGATHVIFLAADTRTETLNDADHTPWTTN